MNFIQTFYKFIKFQTQKTLPQTKATFKALVDAVVPDTPELAEKKGSINSYGALDLHIDEYIIWSFEHYLSLIIVVKDMNIHLANLIADVLNLAAKELVHLGQNKDPINSDLLPEVGTFAALSPRDRFQAITLLDELKIDVDSLPIPFRYYPDFIYSTVVSLVMLPVIGYYTEWSGYGSTRTDKPAARRLEQFPTQWKQVGYPGPAKGYHALRGYMVKKFKG